MNQYGKLFRRKWTGSLFGSGPVVHSVWDYAISMADAPGRVELMPPYLAQVIGCPVEDIRKAIEFLCAPDPDSFTSTDEGRRMTQIGNSLYRLTNWTLYNELCGDDETREYWRKKQSESRERKKAKPTTEAEVQSASEWHVAFGLDLPEPLQTQGCLGAVKFWLQYKAERGESYKPTGLKTALMRWSDQFSPEELSVSIRESMSNNWKGVFKPREAVESNGEYIPNNG